MPHKYGNSIPAGKYADDMVKALAEDEKPVTIRTPQGAITFRRCSRLVGTWGTRLMGADSISRRTLTGGAHLTAYVHDPHHMLSTHQRAYHLKPGWTARHVRNAVLHLHAWQREQCRIRDMRTAVYCDAERHVIPDDFPEEENGHPSTYADMEPADCDYWLNRLADFPLKPPKKE